LRSALYTREPAAPPPPNLYTRVEAKLAADSALAGRLGKPGPEMDSMRWLLGEWEVVAQVQAGSQVTAPERGVSRFVPTLGGTVFEQRDTYPSGTQDLGFLSFSPAANAWHTVAIDSLGNAIVLEGEARDGGLVFEGDVAILGVPTHLRQTLHRESEDAYLLINEERGADGRWILLDTYRYTRKISARR